MNLLDFEFLVILNLFIAMLWPASGYYLGARTPGQWHPISILMMVLTVLAVLGDIIFLVLRFMH